MSRDHTELLKQKHPNLEVEVTDQFIKVKDPDLKMEICSPYQADVEKEAKRLAKRMPK